MELRQSALQAYEINHATQKALAVQTLAQQASAQQVDCTVHFVAPTLPGRPSLPALVPPQNVPRRSPYTAQGHAALMHSIAHIEFNAIDLALDAVWRFSHLPQAYYRDWMQVAGEEAKHFLLLQNHLQSYGFGYGDFTAHDGLWTLCDRTRHDVAARMALIPRTLEARGLDATPVVQNKLRRVGSPQALAAVEILDIILQDEVGHVAIGNRWYHWLCEQRGLDPQKFAANVAQEHKAPVPKPPFNHLARRLAGFSEDEIQALSAAAMPKQ